jgi:hypothetical protein
MKIERFEESKAWQQAYMSPEGAEENSPGRKPGVCGMESLSPGGATHRNLPIHIGIAPSGLSDSIIQTPGSRPGLFSVGPSGLNSITMKQRPRR